jgi:hypothetical protein
MARILETMVITNYAGRRGLWQRATTDAGADSQRAILHRLFDVWYVSALIMLSICVIQDSTPDFVIIQVRAGGFRPLLLAT